jgi:hypothetical protein
MILGIRSSVLALIQKHIDLMHWAKGNASVGRTQ